MTDNKKYYYLKLKEDFFDSEDIKILESMENGYLYSNILLKMYLKSLKNNGELIFKDFIPYNPKMLATVTGHNIDILEKALSIFRQLGLIEVLDNGTIFMLDVQCFIGQISTEGKRKAEYRARIKQAKQELLEDGTNLGQCPNIISISISNSNSNSISYNKKEEEIFKYWNNKEIIEHRELTPIIAKQITKSIKEYGLDNLKTYIDRYAEVYHDKNYYFDTKWTLVEFLKQSNAVSSFTDEGSKWLNYLESKKQKNKKNSALIKQRQYTKEELDSVFDTNLDDWIK